MSYIFRTITKNFLLKEAYKPTVVTYLQSLSDLVEQIRPSSKRDSHRLELARENLSKLKKHFRKMQEHIEGLEEQFKILEENKESK